MKELLQSLQSLGLTDNESKLYLAALELGESGMTDLSVRAKLKRTTAYLAFTSLEQKGLMGSFVMRGRTRFVPTPPLSLKRRAENQVETAERLMPQLAAMRAKGEAGPRISYYEGKEGATW